MQLPSKSLSLVEAHLLFTSRSHWLTDKRIQTDK